MNRQLTTLALGILTLTATPIHATSITAMDSAENLAQHLVGSGINISNVRYTGASKAAGYFTKGSESGLGIESGIILTTGSAASLNGTNNKSNNTTTVNNMAGDDNLKPLIAGGAPNNINTYDATTLEFDFVSSGDSAYFNYLFGSEEYLEWVDLGYNDVFGFFLDGVNLALVPGTNTAVSVDNVNGKKNSSYFKDNHPNGQNGSAYDFEYDGFTEVLTAAATGLIKGQRYHLALSIADVGDYQWDSGVFLSAGSFTGSNSEGNTAPVPEPATIFLFGTGLSFLGSLARRSRKNPKQEIVA